MVNWMYFCVSLLKIHFSYENILRLLTLNFLLACTIISDLSKKNNKIYLMLIMHRPTMPWDHSAAATQDRSLSVLICGHPTWTQSTTRFGAWYLLFFMSQVAQKQKLVQNWKHQNS